MQNEDQGGKIKDRYNSSYAVTVKVQAGKCTRAQFTSSREYCRSINVGAAATERWVGANLAIRATPLRQTQRTSAAWVFVIGFEEGVLLLLPCPLVCRPRGLLC